MKLNKVPLKNVCDISMGQSPAGEFYNENNEGYPMIAGAGDFRELYPLVKKYTTEANKLSKIDDIILCIRATIGDINWSDKIYCLGRGVAGLTPKKEKLDSHYLWHFLISDKNTLFSKATGSTFKQVSKNHIEEWEIPLPDLLTQTQIAKILDKSTALIAKRKAQIAELDTLVQSVFLEMFGDPATNPKGWEESTLDQISLSKGEYGSGSSAIPYKQGYRYVRITDILDNGELKDEMAGIENEEQESQKYTLNEGDIVFARSGATVGKTFLYSSKYGKCIFAGYLIRFKLNKEKVVPEYIKHFTKTHFYWRWVASCQNVVAQPNINAKQYGAGLKIMIPPLELQTKFLFSVKRFEKLKSHLQQSLAELEIQHQALMQRAFRGELV